MKQHESEIKAYIKITELIGEMSLGEGVPIDMPKDSPMIFDAIYHYLKNNEAYQPYNMLHTRLLESYAKINRLEKEIARLKPNA